MKEGGSKRGKILGGALIGTLNGLLGGGGGMVAVPLLERTMPSRKAHATAIAVVLPASALSALVYLFLRPVSLSVLLPSALGVALGGYFGAKLLPVLPVRATDLLFGVLMLLAGIRMLF